MANGKRRPINRNELSQLEALDRAENAAVAPVSAPRPAPIGGSMAPAEGVSRTGAPYGARNSARADALAARAAATLAAERQARLKKYRMKRPPTVSR